MTLNPSGNRTPASWKVTAESALNALAAFSLRIRCLRLMSGIGGKNIKFTSLSAFDAAV